MRREPRLGPAEEFFLAHPALVPGQEEHPTAGQAGQVLQTPQRGHREGEHRVVEPPGIRLEHRVPVGFVVRLALDRPTIELDLQPREQLGIALLRRRAIAAHGGEAFVQRPTIDGEAVVGRAVEEVIRQERDRVDDLSRLQVLTAMMERQRILLGGVEDRKIQQARVGERSQSRVL